MHRVLSQRVRSSVQTLTAADDSILGISFLLSQTAAIPFPSDHNNEPHYCVVPPHCDNAHAQIPTLLAKCNVSLNTSSFSLSAHPHVDLTDMFRQSLKSRENTESHRLI